MQTINTEECNEVWGDINHVTQVCVLGYKDAGPCSVCTFLLKRENILILSSLSLRVIVVVHLLQLEAIPSKLASIRTAPEVREVKMHAKILKVSHQFTQQQLET